MTAGGPRHHGTDGPGSRAVSANMRHWRGQRGLTQTELAVITGLDTATISKIERGKRVISIDDALCIASALGVELAVLLSPIVLCERCGGTGIEPTT